MLLRLQQLGFSLTLPAYILDNQEWGHAQDSDGQFDSSSHIFAFVPGPMQTVQRAEYWGHKGVLLSLVADGDLLATIRSMLRLRSIDTVKSIQG